MQDYILATVSPAIWAMSVCDLKLSPLKEGDWTIIRKRCRKQEKLIMKNQENG
jgi:hypothetical protein